MNEELCEVVERKGSALCMEICPLILWAVLALLRNDPLVPLNFAGLGVSIAVQAMAMFDQASERSGAHK
jgi:hypothetical protein